MATTRIAAGNLPVCAKHVAAAAAILPAAASHRARSLQARATTNNINTTPGSAHGMATQATSTTPNPPSSTPLLFSPIQLRSVTVRNRIFLSPMCMYSAKDGLPNDWHLVHLGARAAGGCGLVMAEATSVVPEGRISPSDAGLWNEEQVQAWRPIVDFIRRQGAVPAIQLAHAGRKASTCEPFVEGGRPLIPGKDERAWQVVGPSPLPFAPGFQNPAEMSRGDIEAAVEAFAESAKRALRAGFEVIEVHMAHGYLLHQFLSPLTNARTDEYGGSLENRMRFPLAVAEAVRQAIPQELPLLVRISATDWADTPTTPTSPSAPSSWDADQSVQLVSQLLSRVGVDLVDVSSGGLLPRPPPGVGPGFQVPFSERIRREAGAVTGAVGLITSAAQAECILQRGQADAIFLGRVMLRDPHWPLRAAAELGHVDAARYPPQYERGKFAA